MPWSVLVKGFAGHPLHPPLTDATIGAFTVGTIAAVLAWLELFPEVLAPTALGALVLGLVFAIPTVVTGFADFLDLAPREPARTVGILHMALMGLAASGFLVAALLLLPVREGTPVSAPAALTALGSLLVLTAGGWAGGSLAYVYGVRVLGTRAASPGEALQPHLDPGEPDD